MLLSCRLWYDSSQVASGMFPRRGRVCWSTHRYIHVGNLRFDLRYSSPAVDSPGVLVVIEVVPMTPLVFKYAEIAFLSVCSVPVVYLMYVDRMVGRTLLRRCCTSLSSVELTCLYEFQHICQPGVENSLFFQKT